MKTTHILIRVSPEEKQELKALADEANLTMSEFVRNTLLNRDQQKS